MTTIVCSPFQIVLDLTGLPSRSELTPGTCSYVCIHILLCAANSLALLPPAW